MKTAAVWCAALAALGLVACGGAKTTESASGTIALSISGPASSGALASALKQAVGEFDAAGKIANVNLWADGLDAACLDGWYATLPYAPSFPITDTLTKMPSCRYVFHANAVDASGIVLYEASAPITVSDRQMSVLNLVLQQKVAPGTVAVVAPQISGVTITGTYPPVIGKPVRLTATVNSTPAPKFAWTVSCPGDQYLPSFTGKTTTATDLTLYGCETDAVVTFTVADDEIVGAAGSLSSTISFVLPYARQGVEVGGINLNSYPNINSLRASSNAAPAPSTTVNLVADVDDPDGDALDLAWSDNCGGSFSGQGSLTPVWTAPAVPGAVCVITLRADEKDSNAPGHTDGFNSATLKLQVAPAVLTLQPFIDVCNSTTWVCAPVSVYAGAQASVDASGLHLVKTAADGGGVAFGPNARVSGVAGMIFSSASFDASGTGIGAGSPRFVLHFEGGNYCALDAPAVSGTTFTFDATASCGAGILSGLDIVADMGGQVGSVDITNVTVNGIAVR